MNARGTSTTGYKLLNILILIKGGGFWGTPCQNLDMKRKGGRVCIPTPAPSIQTWWGSNLGPPKLPNIEWSKVLTNRHGTFTTPPQNVTIVKKIPSLILGMQVVKIVL